MPPKRKASEMEQPQPFEREDYQIGVVCALPIEEAAIHATLDGDKHPGLTPMGGDDNQYTFGRIGDHNVVIACLPAGSTGTASACNVATNMQRSFPIKFGLMVGIAGGVWSEKNDVHLGDVVVSQPKEQFGGVVQYDFGKTAEGGTFKRTSSLNQPPKVLLQSLSSLQRDHFMKGKKLAVILEAMFKKEAYMTKDFGHPGLEHDQLFDASYDHTSGPKNCSRCDKQKVPPEWKPRSTTDSEVHYGTIASANQVMRDGLTRDKIAKDLGAICFEMEAAGLMNNFPCLVIRGICGYADTHKNKRWQGYAAFVAAAFAKELLGFVPSQEVVKMPPAYNKHYMLPRSSSASFTGRSNVVEKLQQQLCSAASEYDNKQRRYVLAGMAGVGKSEICLKVVENLRERFWGVFWIDASSEITAERGFVDIARTCDIADQTFHGAKSWLAANEQTWLLVVDNADNPKFHYAEYFPPGNKGCIILTTRNPDFAKYETVGSHELENLNTSEALALLLKTVRLKQELWKSYEPAAEKVVSTLGCHALAIVQAGAFIRKRLCRLDEYPALFEQQRKWLLQHPLTQEQTAHGDVYATFEVSARYLEDSDEKSAKYALELLRFLAFVHFDNVPISIITRAWESIKRVDTTKREPLDPEFSNMSMWHVSQLPAFVGNLLDGKIDIISLREARAELASFSLISVSEATENMTMHPLAHAWARDRLRYLERQEARSSASCVLALPVYRDPTDINISDPFWFHLQPHVESHLHAWDQESAVVPYPILQCFYWFGHLFLRLEYDSEAEPVFQSIFDSQLFQTSANFPAKAGTIASLAVTYIASGKAMEARELLEEHIQVQGLRLDAKQPYSVHVYQVLARTYKALGDNDKAMEVLEKVMHFQQQVPKAPEDSWLSHTYYQLGSLYVDIQQSHKAIPLIKKAVEIDKTLSDTEIYQVGSSLEGLARAYLAVGETDEAIQLWEEIWRIRKNTLHRGHPSRRRSQTWLAQAYIQKTEYYKAIELLEDVLEIDETTGLGVDHPKNLTARHESGRAYLAAGEIDKAINLLEQVVRIKKGVLKANDRELLISQSVLAYAYLGAGKTLNAIPLLLDIVQNGDTSEWWMVDAKDRLERIIHQQEHSQEGTLSSE